ncbi:hypothetical protein AUI06_09100 [archaeon 13_2_20CM_2_52_21]|nr:MAG: hypothetical protein AUI06_09100 [archaeon 13_2_20CM_2_52_21]
MYSFVDIADGLIKLADLTAPFAGLKSDGTTEQKRRTIALVTSAVQRMDGSRKETSQRSGELLCRRMTLLH